MTKETHSPQTPSSQPPPNKITTVSVDLEKYVEMLAELDMPLTEKQRCLQSLEMILLSFVDLGFGVNFTSDTCGQGHETQADGLCQRSAEMVNSLHTIIIEEPSVTCAEAEGRAS